MLESVTIKKIATYDDSGIQITDLKKVNFIYGANGSGKTTLTRYLADTTNPQFSDCSHQWQNNSPIKTLVYNKEFRENSFKNGKMTGVFTLGHATPEQIKSLKLLEVELEVIRQKGFKKRNTLDKQVESKQQNEVLFRDKVWENIFRKYEVDFKEAFVGFQKGEKFRNKLLEEFHNNTSPFKSYAELKRKAETVFGKPPTTLQSISTIDFARLIEIETHNIWQKKIIGKTDVDIAILIQKLNLNDWVNQGRIYLQEDETCPFCQQPTITEDFRKQLENYFDETFTTDTKLVKDNNEEYNRLALNLTNLLLEVETAEKANTETKLNTESFSAHLKTLSSQFISNRELLNNKIKEPSRSIDLISVKEQLENIQQLITEANTAIAAHNFIVTNYKSERTDLIQEIWKFLFEESREHIEDYEKKSKGLQKGIEALTVQRQELLTQYNLQNNKIVQENKNVTSVQPSIDEINNTLKYYDILNFKIVPFKTEKNMYQILREDGTLADSTLSEGEITFLTFLHFLQFAKGGITAETVLDERILVVDDPISSLDSNVLFVVSALLKEIIKAIKQGESKIKQIILLTHNVYFHKEVSFVDRSKNNDSETFYWILRRKGIVSTIQKYEMKNPIQNSYELLWQELKNRDANSDITIQNTMRRIIENYFKILGRYADDHLIDSFQIPQEQEICRSLICWINDGSHSIPDDIFIEYQESVIDKYFEVFKKIFYQMGHSAHYGMMMREHQVETIA